MSEKMNTFLYFAYGSNMLLQRLRERTPSAIPRNVGFLTGRRLTFDKVSSDESGKCDIEKSHSPTDRVYGVIFEINNGEKARLDQAEGRGNGYCEERVTVIAPSGNVEAIAYLATAKNPVLHPYHWYKAIVVAGAVQNGLPQPYIEWLRTIESLPDSNVARRSKNEAFLFHN